MSKRFQFIYHAFECFEAPLEILPRLRTRLLNTIRHYVTVNFLSDS
jgi:hypothetical protein